MDVSVSNFNSTPAFRGLEYDDFSEVNYPVSVETKPDSFEKQSSTEKVIKTGFNAVAVSGPAYGVAKNLGKKASNAANNTVKEVLQDFGKDTIEKVSKESGKLASKLKNLKGKIIVQLEDGTRELSKNAKGAVKWGVAAAVFSSLLYLGVKDSDKDGKNDLIEGISKFFKPSSNE